MSVLINELSNSVDEFSKFSVGITENDHNKHLQFLIGKLKHTESSYQENC